MHVNMVCDSRSRRPAEIHTQVEALRTIDLAQRGLTKFRQIHQFVSCFLGRRIELAKVRVWNYQQMTAYVRIEIQDDIVVSGPAEDELFRVVVGILVQLAKDAAGCCGLFTPSRIKVFVAPGTP